MLEPRGALPARVYWTRRGVVIGVALLFVYLFAHLLAGGGGSSSPASAHLSDHHAQASSSPKPTPSAVVTKTTSPNLNALTGKQGKAGKHGKKNAHSAADLAAPSGPCNAAQMAAQPLVKKAKAGNPVRIKLALTSPQAACTFDASGKSIAVKISSGSDGIWSSQDCHGVIGGGNVVVRSAQPAVVPVKWSGRRSQPGDCGPSNDWAQPGYYHVLAAVIGGNPTDTQFRLSVPPTPVITKTAHPKPHKHHAGSSPTASDAAQGKGTSCGGDIAAGNC